jgi:hypothetical protein
VTVQPEDFDWQISAACRNKPTAMFIPPAEKPRRFRPEAAIAVCKACHVRADCAARALADISTVGVWGGFYFRGEDYGGAGARRVRENAAEWLKSGVLDAVT